MFPRLKSLPRRVHGGLNMLSAGFLVDSNDLRGARRIQRLDLVGSLDPLPADDQVILAAKLSAHSFDGSAHLARILFVAKIKKWLIDERALMGGCPWPDWSL